MSAYGKSRRFKGIEAFAIQIRLRVAVEAVRRLAATKDNISVLELGCGYHASNLKYLKTLFPAVSSAGVDVDLDQTLAHDLTLFRANLEEWHPPTTFDCVLSLAVVEHMISPAKHFSLISACLSENGIAILTTPTPASDMVLRLLAATHIFDEEAVSDHKLYLTGAGIRRLAQSAGLTLGNQHTIAWGMNRVCELTKATGVG